ncbi:MAG: hypothetical protein U9N35_06200 [Euryarchaeota archaeon]|nr:hypothetical protein [Euryarchaeota archaeon]
MVNDVFEYGEHESGQVEKGTNGPIEPEPSFSSWTWIIMAALIVLVAVTLFWEEIKTIGFAALSSMGIFTLFIILNIVKFLKKKKK